MENPTKKPLIDYDTKTKEFIFNPTNFLEYYQCQLWWYKFLGEYNQSNYDFVYWIESELFYWHNSKSLIALHKEAPIETKKEIEIADWVNQFNSEYDCVKYLVEIWNNNNGKHNK